MPAQTGGMKSTKPPTSTNRNTGTTSGGSSSSSKPLDVGAAISGVGKNIANKTLESTVGAISDLNNDPYRGRQIIDDKQWETLKALGYDEAQLRQQYIPKAEKDVVKSLGSLYFDAPIYKTKDPEKEAKDSQSMRSMVTQMVLAPYIRKIGDQFQQQRGGVQASQNALMQQIAPQYQPYLQAMNNATYQAQDQSLLDALNSATITPVIDTQNQLLQDYINQMKASAGSGGDQFLQALMSGQVTGG